MSQGTSSGDTTHKYVALPAYSTVTLKPGTTFYQEPNTNSNGSSTQGTVYDALVETANNKWVGVIIDKNGTIGFADQGAIINRGSRAPQLNDAQITALEQDVVRILNRLVNGNG